MEFGSDPAEEEVVAVGFRNWILEEANWKVEDSSHFCKSRKAHVVYQPSCSLSSPSILFLVLLSAFQ